MTTQIKLKDFNQLSFIEGGFVLKHKAQSALKVKVSKYPDRWVVSLCINNNIRSYELSKNVTFEEFTAKLKNLIASTAV